MSDPKISILFVTPENAQQPPRATRNEAAKRQYLEGLEEMRRGAVKAAEALVELKRCRHYELESCGSIEEFARKNGANDEETRRLLSLGRATEAKPEMKELVLEGRVSIESGSCAGKVLAKPEMQRAGDDWLKWAAEDSPKEFRKRVAERVEEVRSGGEPALSRILTALDRAWEKFARARVIASRSARTTLSEGETLETISDFYLDRTDPMRKEGAARRMPDTLGTPGRKMPAEELRKVLARNDDRCQYPGCTNRIWLENAHRIPHSRGGGREAADTLRFCKVHHRMFDAGLFRAIGPADNPTFLDREGRPISARAPPKSGSSPPSARGG